MEQPHGGLRQPVPGFDKKPRRRGLTGSRESGLSEREVLHSLIAREAAAEGIVLLKNEGGLLPLKRGERIALYGGLHTLKGGTGSADVNERKTLSIHEGLVQAGFVITTEPWLVLCEEAYEEARAKWKDLIYDKMRSESLPFHKAYFDTVFHMPCGPLPEPTFMRSDDARLAVFVLARTAGEGRDRRAEAGDYYLSDEEAVFLRELALHYTDMALVINSGGPVDLSFSDSLPALRSIVLLGQAGQECGAALADVLSGTAVPSGRLSDTWALRYEDYPNAAYFGPYRKTGLRDEYREGIYVGYRYFDSFGCPCRYGFGFGLSYTEFDIEAEELFIQGDSVCLRVSVQNSGSTWAGKEVVQLYVSPPQSGLAKEFRRLAAFKKTALLAPAEKEVIVLRVPLERLASYDEGRSAWILEAGLYGLWLGNSLEASRLAGALSLSRVSVLRQCSEICPLPKDNTETAPRGAEIPYAAIEPPRQALRKREEEWQQRLEAESLPLISIDSLCSSAEREKRPHTDSLCGNTEAEQRQLPPPESPAHEIARALPLSEAARLTVGAFWPEGAGEIGASGFIPGAAGETYGGLTDPPWNLASLVLADGPGGLRLRQSYRVRDGRWLKEADGIELDRAFFAAETHDAFDERRYQFCTAIPTATVLAQTWNPDLVQKTGSLVGEEMNLFEITLWLAPSMNIHRNPLGGRNFEYYSEDPLLTGLIAAALVRGVQDIAGCGAVIKHYACNNQEDNRLASDSRLSERALREIYLKGFEIVVKTARPFAMMSAYNMINSVYAACNYDLCTRTARTEWGFEGIIMTDWMATLLASDGKCSASACIRAGTDLIMPGTEADFDDICRALREGRLSEDELRMAAARIISVILKSNQYENPAPAYPGTPAQGA